MTQAIRVMIADDHPLILLGTALSLADDKQFVVTGKARNSTELIALLSSLPCDVLVCDLAMPGGAYGDGLPMIGYIHRHYPHVHLIVQTMLDNPGILKGLQQSGVRGVLNKGDDMALIASAVLSVMHGNTFMGPSIRRAFESVGLKEQEGAQSMTLSKRESEVLRLYVSGDTVKEIAENLKRSVKTISTQKMCAMQKLGVNRDADLFKYAQMSGLLKLPSVVEGELPIVAHVRRTPNASAATSGVVAAKATTRTGAQASAPSSSVPTTVLVAEADASSAPGGVD